MTRTIILIVIDHTSTFPRARGKSRARALLLVVVVVSLFHQGNDHMLVFQCEAFGGIRNLREILAVRKLENEDEFRRDEVCN